jgi:DNA replication protein DnaC
MSVVAESPDLIPAIQEHCRQMKLPTVARRCAELAEQARRSGMDPLAFLHGVLAAEQDDRRSRRAVRRIKEAAFPQVKTLEGFDFAKNPHLDEGLIRSLMGVEFVTEGRPVLFLGGSGTGKSHLATAIGVAACNRGYAVRYVAASALINELVEAQESRALSRIVNRYARFDLLIVDDLGYLPLPAMAAQLLFQVVAERSERKSTVITTNQPFSEWTGVIADPRLCRAFVERITFRAHIVETGDESVRLLETLKTQAAARGRKGVVATS